MAETELEPLSTKELQTLTNLEEKISKSFRIFFYEVGSALREIHAFGLYRSTHKTFEDYLISRWEIKKTSGYQLISAANTYDRLKESGAKILPDREAYIRPLTSLPPDKQVEAWRKVTEVSGAEKISTSLVVEVVREFKSSQDRQDKCSQDRGNSDNNCWIYIGKKVLPLGNEDNLYPFDILESNQTTNLSSSMVCLSVRKSGEILHLPLEQIKLLPKIGEWIRYQEMDLRVVEAFEGGIRTQSALIPLGADWTICNEPYWHNARAKLNPYLDQVLAILGERITWIPDINDFLVFPDKFCFFPSEDWRWDLLPERLSCSPEGLIFMTPEKWKYSRIFELTCVYGHSVLFDSSREETFVIYCCNSFSFAKFSKIEEIFSPFLTYRQGISQMVKEFNSINRQEEQ